MIQANELRIGNWVLYAGLWQRVYSIAETAINIAQEPLKISFIGGIPLTPEILERYGFENDSYANFTILMPDNALSKFKSNARWIRVSFKEYACLNLSEYIDIADYDISAPCKYLHQLQNLYFTLTGKELKIKRINTPTNNC